MRVQATEGGVELLPSQRSTACTEHTTTHLITAHSLLPLDLNHPSGKSVVEYEKLSGIHNAEGPGFAILKNCGLRHPF